MALINRVTRLFQADLNAVLDRVEQPEILLQQSILDMEKTLDADEKRCREVTLERTELARSLADLEATLKDLVADLDVCFNTEELVFARGILRRKLETERNVRCIKTRDEALRHELEQLTMRINEGKTQLHNIRLKAEAISPKAGPLKTDHWAPSFEHVSDEEVEIALLQERQRRQAS